MDAEEAAAEETEVEEARSVEVEVGVPVVDILTERVWLVSGTGVGQLEQSRTSSFVGTVLHPKSDVHCRKEIGVGDRCLDESRGEESE